MGSSPSSVNPSEATGITGRQAGTKWLLLGLVLLVSVLLKLHYADSYVTFRDELLSAYVAEGISETGLPLTSPGTIYPRALLHHYLLAIPIGLFGVGYLPMRLLPILLSTVTLTIVFLLGCRMANCWVGLAAAFLLSISSTFSQFALSGRMYMTYATFHTLTLYLFFEGFVRGKPFARWLAIVSMLATMLSSELGLLLGPVMAFLLLVYFRREWLQETVLYVGAVVWALGFWLVYLYDLPGRFYPLTDVPPKINLRLPLPELAASVTWAPATLDRALPFSLAILVSGLLLVLASRSLSRNFALIALVPILLVLSVFVPYRVQHRMVAALLPLYFLAVCQMASLLGGWVQNLRSSQRTPLDIARVTLTRPATLAVVFVLMSLFVVARNGITGPLSFGSYLWNAFGYHDYRTDRDPAPAYEVLQAQFSPHDLTVVTTVEYGYFFLGREHEFLMLRQRPLAGQSGGFGSYEVTAEPYFGVPLVDSVEEVRELAEQPSQTIWIALSARADRYVGEEILEVIRDDFELVFDDPEPYGIDLYRSKPELVDISG